MTIQSIQNAVNAVIDPDLGKSLGELGALHDVQTNGNSVSLYLRLIQPLHFVAESINAACKNAVLSVFPEAVVDIFVQEILPPQPKNRILPGAKNLIAVASGKGGVGKSTVAANLAAALSMQGASVGLLDADIHGPSAPTMFGLGDEQLLAEKLDDGRIMGYPHEKFGIKICSIGFVMGRDQAAIMRGPMQAGYFNTLVDQMYWGDLDYLIFDLPPGTGDIQLTLAQRVPLTGAVIVTTPQDIALVDVRRGISMFHKVNVDILGVVENMSYHVCPSCGFREDIFAHGGGKHIADELQTPFLGELPLNIKVREGGDAGKPAVLNSDAQQEADAIVSIAKNLARETRRKNLRDSSAPTLEISI